MKTNHAMPCFLRLCLAAAALSATAWVQAAPIDPISNPDKREYNDMGMSIPEYDVPFKRDGDLFDPQALRDITHGLPAVRVLAILGEPLEKTAQASGSAWNYHIKLAMPESNNFLVCQYKLLFDAQEQVKETIWRRHQCLDIVNETAPR